MPVITTVNTNYSPLLNTSTTGSDIVARAGQEVRNVLDPTNAADQVIFLDYLNRVQLQMLRASRWTFLISAPQFFITERGQTDYFIGPLGTALPGQVDTALDLNDVDYVLRNSVFDATNARGLQKSDAKPYSTGLSLQDAQFKQGRPAEWRNDLLDPNVIQIYPAADNQNGYQPVPSTPYVSSTASGSLLDRTYYTVTTLVDSFGNESTCSQREAFTKVPGGYVAIVHSPNLPYGVSSTDAGYTQWNVYIGTATSQWTKQNASPIDIATDWTEPVSGLITGTTPPTTNSVIPMDGYLITFRYFQQRQTVQTLDTVIQIPDVYKDIVCAGVTWLSCQYLKLYQEANAWQQIYANGIRDMVRDRNAGPKEDDFIAPDVAALGMGSNLSYVDTFDLSR